MILYSLQCSQGHGFDEWFSNSAEYDSRKDGGELTCPECGDKDVTTECDLAGLERVSFGRKF